MAEASPEETASAPEDSPEPIRVVNEYIQRFGEEVAAQLAPLDADGHTALRHGPYVIGINVKVGRGMLVMLVKLGAIAIPSEANYRQVLEANFMTTGGCAIAIDPDRDLVFLKAMRTVKALDYLEFRDLLQTMAKVASDVAPKLDILGNAAP